MSDMLHIPEGGEVAILEKSTRQIYTYNAPKGEKVKVAKILIDAKKQAGNSIAAINNELMTSINAPAAHVFFILNKLGRGGIFQEPYGSK